MMKILLLGLLFASCATKSPDDSPEIKKADIYYQQGTSQLIRQDYTGALSNLLAAFRLNPKDSKVNNNLAMAYFFKGEMPLAEQHLLKAIDLDAENLDAKNNLASLYLDRGDDAKAEELYLEISKGLTYETQFRTYYNLAIIERRRGNHAQAIKYLERSRADNINYCPAPFEMGEIYFERGLFAKALESYQEASKGECFKNPLPRLQMARTLAKLGLFDRAEKTAIELKSFQGAKPMFQQIDQFLAELSAKNTGNSLDITAPERNTSLQTELSDKLDDKAEKKRLSDGPRPINNTSPVF